MSNEESLFVWRGSDDDYERWARLIKTKLQDEEVIQAIERDLSGGDANQKKKDARAKLSN